MLLDLAVPRDIEPSLGRKENITLYDMDSFHTEKLSPEANESLVRAAAIVEEQMAEFFQWLDGRDVIPRIQEIKAEAVQDLNLRIEKILKKTPMQEEDRVQLLEAVIPQQEKLSINDLRAQRQPESGSFSGMCGRIGRKLYEE